MYVKVKFYTGSPDPQWHEGDDFAARFFDIVAGLKKCDKPPARPEYGYRGFVVKDGLLRYEADVFGGYITVRSYADGPCPLEYLADPKMRAERLLMKVAKSHLPADVYERITSSVRVAS
jgi:hypothetical protein